MKNFKKNLVVPQNGSKAIKKHLLIQPKVLYESENMLNITHKQPGHCFLSHELTKILQPTTILCVGFCLVVSQ